MDVRGFNTTVTGNNIYTFDKEKPTRLRITGSNAVVTANVFENVVIEVNDATGRNLPILIKDNLMTHSTIEHQKGNLITNKTQSDGLHTESPIRPPTTPKPIPKNEASQS